MNQGDILLVRYPFSNLSDYKIRPAIVVSNTAFNEKHDAWICPVTSKHHDQNILFDGSLTEGTLNKQSYAKPSTIITVNEETILKRVGSLRKEKLLQIIETIKKNLN